MSDENTDNTSSSQPLTATAQVAKDLMELAKNDENTILASKNFGESAVIISKTIKNCLLPLAAVNFGIDKAKRYFEERFKIDLEEKIQSIPAENIVEPKASIAGPALQNLAFSHEEPDLKDMYLNLISSAMNSEKNEDTHPAFVEIIKQLTSEEARLLPLFLKNDVPNTIARVVYKQEKSGSQIDGYKHILPLTSGGENYYNKHIPSFVDNWLRLGIIEVKYDTWVLDDRYDALEMRDEYIEDQLDTGGEYTKTLGKGIIRRTTFGAQFAAIVGLTNE
ncbi:DUF4393 domain-containing protein [Citrobacter portucalensis]|uniref:DUF4393 domain-containing protein n=1 Tax=Citrobacter portucalensis TaxID=1639133 RepID=UPI0013FE1C0E|nr:DUF4393 domain-containing protein [Citrobacter portucalensis]